MSIPVITAENIWRIYYYVGMFASIFFVIKLIMFSIVGSDSEVFGDFNTEIDTDCSFHFLSIQAIIAFFMGFGWMGYAGLQQFKMPQIQTFIIALIVGLIFMFVTAFLMFATRKLEKKVVKSKETALNKVGKAYTHFEPNSMGQVEIEINGQLSVTDAMNQSDSKINSFDYVRVVKVIDNVLYIEKIEKE